MNRLIPLLLVLGAVISPARAQIVDPASRDAMGLDHARVLLTRTGFGASMDAVRRFARLSRAEAVERLLDRTTREAVSSAPAWTSTFDSPRGLSEDDRKAWRRRQRERGRELQQWWLGEMLDTASPLTERMTLFWHSHFGTSMRKVRSANLMYVQNVTLRRDAVGRFDRLLHAMVRDPALLVYLDAQVMWRSKPSAKPNENLARELMELFTLGPGHYTQHDVSEAARALTGLGIDPRSGRVRALPRHHDDGEKAVLGMHGRLTGADVVERLLAHPASAEHLVRKLWREFISPDPDPQQVRTIADALRRESYDLKVALRALLNSDALYAESQRGTLVKSPVDFTIGTLRTLAIRPPQLAPIAAVTGAMGQALFAPPSVKGWSGGAAWIDANTLQLRRRFIDAMLDRMTQRLDQQAGQDMSRAMNRNARTARGLTTIADRRSAGALRFLLLAMEPVDPLPERATGIEHLRALLHDPAYQLR